MLSGGAESGMEQRKSSGGLDDGEELLNECNEQNISEQCRSSDRIIDSRFYDYTRILVVIVSYIMNLFCFCDRGCD